MFRTPKVRVIDHSMLRFAHVLTCLRLLTGWPHLDKSLSVCPLKELICTAQALQSLWIVVREVVYVFVSANNVAVWLCAVT